MRSPRVDADGTDSTWSDAQGLAAEGRLIGDYLVEFGALKPTDVDGVRQWQAKSGLRFGEAALQLGLVTHAAVSDALAHQYHYPKLLDPRGALSAELVMATRPSHAVSEQLRTLRTQLVVRWGDAKACHTVCVVSTARGEGRSFIAANLAIAFAQINLRTLLLDLDMRCPSQHELFGLPNRHGVSNVLIGRVPIDEAQVAQASTLSVMACGPEPPNPQELLSAAALTPVLDALRLRHDVIVIDTPAWCVGADALLISAQVQDTLLISRPGHSLQRPTRQMVTSLRKAGARIVGAVLNQR
ncbi:polysaccharide biosynthesis tyrosine autokinase [Piscinibacter sp.]|jgi:receptor protein-tyrosine kinase|uniref:polysaccharide biosynthesis tyrosine autokinase n=1 Tax=Piscinibacter sp. TaxID=1903157 RepID=UPI002F415D5B